MAATSAAVVVALIIQTSRVSVLNRHLKAYPPTPAELDEIRRVWEVEKAAHEQDYETWDYARVAHEADVEHWLRVRNDHHQLRAYEADRLGLSWDRIEGHECVAYGTREYTARLAINQLEACHNMAFVVDGIAADEPHECHAEGDTFKSVWKVNNDTACKPYWGDLYDKGCVGRGSGKHRFEARLWDINGKDGDVFYHSSEDRWQALWSAYALRAPYVKGPLYGMVGMWDVDDFFCRFG
ncbi:hypothetical protein DAEQUDRAFT_761311 [Daedalea quercina L-15889]|uniref:Uncharacterized protein n=1 Tax=Daedalea quercina L-15889 TaxID=1314783 RepID=A0A165U6B0_9APHY|nr:hypothetical protein DAEQUDRAFT_761311 [Daedalea quercina L-15889]